MNDYPNKNANNEKLYLGIIYCIIPAAFNQ
jgi:hypothetical protein